MQIKNDSGARMEIHGTLRPRDCGPPALGRARGVGVGFEKAVELVGDGVMER